jgi:hypothetical protein
METFKANLGLNVWDLPPLILHPFNERVSPSTLLENSKAALMLTGLIPSDGSDEEALHRRLVAGRYSEIRMLYFIGKDVFRWLGQCEESTERFEELRGAGVRRQSFARLLTVSPPPNVAEKLKQWGVADYIHIFSRAIGLNSMFAEPPSLSMLGEEFLLNYHRYADLLYQGFMESENHYQLTDSNFHFELYASGEYSRMLESEWESDSGFEGSPE